MIDLMADKMNELNINTQKQLKIEELKSKNKVNLLIFKREC